MIDRKIKQHILPLLGSNKAILIMGARQVGKSTLLRTMLGNRDDVMWLNGDDIDVQNLFRDISSTRLRAIIGSNRIVVIDEAQRIPDIGLRMKLITDQIEGVQVVATGSSSFQLAAKVNESLTGRKREFRMFPLTF
ncbi:MAG: AAA family ATPase, partial [Bacteroidales bacterium]|nr:AAA family ATPase [Bacteroidales bacterium]